MTNGTPTLKHKDNLQRIDHHNHHQHLLTPPPCAPEEGKEGTLKSNKAFYSWFLLVLFSVVVASTSGLFHSTNAAKQLWRAFGVAEDVTPPTELGGNLPAMNVPGGVQIVPAVSVQSIGSVGDAAEDFGNSILKAKSAEQIIHRLKPEDGEAAISVMGLRKMSPKDKPSVESLSSSPSQISPPSVQDAAAAVNDDGLPHVIIPPVPSKPAELVDAVDHAKDLNPNQFASPEVEAAMASAVKLYQTADFVGGAFAGCLLDTLGPKVTQMLGQILCAFSFLLFANGTLAVAAFIQGLTVTTILTSVVSVGNLFQDKETIAMGVIVGSSEISQLVLPLAVAMSQLWPSFTYHGFMIGMAWLCVAAAVAAFMFLPNSPILSGEETEERRDLLSRTPRSASAESLREATKVESMKSGSNDSLATAATTARTIPPQANPQHPASQPSSPDYSSTGNFVVMSPRDVEQPPPRVSLPTVVMGSPQPPSYFATSPTMSPTRASARSSFLNPAMALTDRRINEATSLLPAPATAEIPERLQSLPLSSQFCHPQYLNFVIVWVICAARICSYIDMNESYLAKLGDDGTMAYIYSWLLPVSGVFSVVFGALAQRWGIRYAMVVQLALSALLSILCCIPCLMLQWVTFFVFFFINGGVWALIVAYISIVFGFTNFGVLNAFASLAAGAVNQFIGAPLTDGVMKSGDGDWFYVNIGQLVVCAIAIVPVWFILRYEAPSRADRAEAKVTVKSRISVNFAAARYRPSVGLLSATNSTARRSALL